MCVLTIPVSSWYCSVKYLMVQMIVKKKQNQSMEDGGIVDSIAHAASTTGVLLCSALIRG